MSAVSELRERIGVTESVAVKMLAVRANALREDGVLFRTCEHGVRHPVGDIHTGSVSAQDNEVHAKRCCSDGCCSAWLIEQATKPVAVDPHVRYEGKL